MCSHEIKHDLSVTAHLASLHSNLERNCTEQGLKAYIALHLQCCTDCAGQAVDQLEDEGVIRFERGQLTVTERGHAIGNLPSASNAEAFMTAVNRLFD